MTLAVEVKAKADNETGFNFIVVSLSGNQPKVNIIQHLFDLKQRLQCRVVFP